MPGNAESADPAFLPGLVPVAARGARPRGRHPRRDGCSRAADGRRRWTFQRRGAEVGEMVHRERGGVVAGRALGALMRAAVVIARSRAVELRRRSIRMAARALGVYVERPGLPVWGGLPSVAAHVRTTECDGVVERRRPGLRVVRRQERHVPGGRPGLGAVVMVQGSGPQPVVAGIAGDRGPRAVQGDVHDVRPGDVRIRRPRGSAAVRRERVAGGAGERGQWRGRDVARLADGPGLRRRRGDVVTGATAPCERRGRHRVVGGVVIRDRVRDGRRPVA